MHKHSKIHNKKAQQAVLSLRVMSYRQPLDKKIFLQKLVFKSSLNYTFAFEVLKPKKKSNPIKT